MKLIGNGGIRQVSGKKWEAWQFVEIDGQRRQKTRTVAGGKKDAYKALRDFQSELAEQVPTADTFASYAASWLAWRIDNGVIARSTYKNLQSMVNAFSPYFDCSLTDITPPMCRAALADLKSTRQWSGTTCRTKYAMLHSLFAQAVKDGLITTNPLDAVEAPALDTQERIALSPYEIDSLWSRTEQLPLTSYTMAVFLALDCGLRIGECVWLKTQDVRDTSIKVSRSKTAAGLREIPLTTRLQKKCAEWKTCRRERGIDDAITFCCRLDGLPMAPQTLHNWYVANHKAMQAPVKFHDLRHANLSKMARYMGAHDLQRWAGWSSLAMAQRYVHDDYSQLEAAVKRSENVG